ncbi:hypothetical protein EUAN_23600 [Andreesenia angusta]|uniref:Uncharacterized protein n=1 Tax=Andreesenia angusta TaxID=39480 RepID=A0A1S1V6F6_9FIRM|nr:helix-turn-helix domain-containing protein [Andreesenia angusta]OHW61279.1 hypothetical protein EUAN_23600 [Andreesenia angusta]
MNLVKAIKINRHATVDIAIEYGLRGIETEIYAAIRCFKCNKNHTATPSIGTIAEISGYCKNTVKKYIRRLVNKGVLWMTERPILRPDGVKWNYTHLYTFVAEKYGQAKFQKKNEVEFQKESPYQKMKATFESARTELMKTYDAELCNKAFKICISNIRSGITGFIMHPLNYMKSIIKNILKESALAKVQKEYAESVADLEPVSEPKKTRSEKPRYDAPYSQPRKTTFHNFEQRSSKYSNDDLEALIREKNGRR